MRRFLFFTLVLAGLSRHAQAQSMAIVDATVYSDPQSPAQPHTTILILEGKIAALGPRVHLPRHVPILPCEHCIVFAGFWNTHVHFTGSQWENAAHLDPNRLTHDMQTMLSHSGFTSVVDTASDPENTVALRHRIEAQLHSRGLAEDVILNAVKDFDIPSNVREV